MKLLIELHYLPCIEYFCALQQFDQIMLEANEHFIKQTYRNRCYINTSQGKLALAVPLTEKHGKVSIKEVRIDYSQKWQNNHWRTIESAYRKAPYFEYYAEALKKIIYKKHDSLFDLNRELLSFCLKSLKTNLTLSETVAYQTHPDEGVLDIRNEINAKKSGSYHNFFQPKPYYQVFGNGFVENLSLIDLLFCEGPMAPSHLRSCQKADLNK